MSAVSLEPKISRSVKRSLNNVHFDESSNESYENNLCFEELKDLWYTTKDIQMFKSYYIISLRDILQDDSLHKDNDQSYAAVFQRVYEACCEAGQQEWEPENISCSDERLFHYWVAVTSTDRLGLERSANRFVGRDKSARRKKLVAALRRLQQEWSAGRDDVTCELIRNTCQEISKPSRNFARRLAVAQALAS